jgi:anti-anti-sigma factor
LALAKRPHTRRSEDGSLRIAVAADAEARVLRLAGALTLDTAPMVEAEVYALFDAGVRTLVLDLDQLEFVDPMGERCLLSVVRWSRQNGGVIHLAGAEGRVEQALALTGDRRGA